MIAQERAPYNKDIKQLVTIKSKKMKNKLNKTQVIYNYILVTII